MVVLTGLRQKQHLSKKTEHSVGSQPGRRMQASMMRVVRVSVKDLLPDRYLRPFQELHRTGRGTCGCPVVVGDRTSSFGEEAAAIREDERHAVSLGVVTRGVKGS